MGIEEDLRSLKSNVEDRLKILGDIVIASHEGLACEEPDVEGLADKLLGKGVSIR